MLNVRRFPFPHIKKQPKKVIKFVYLVQQVFMKLHCSHNNSVITTVTKNQMHEPNTCTEQYERHCVNF